MLRPMGYVNLIISTLIDLVNALTTILFSPFLHKYFLVIFSDILIYNLDLCPYITDYSF